MPHLGLELLNYVARIDTTHIPYKGGAPSMTDLLGGQIDFIVSNLPVSLPYVKAGKLRALAVTSAKRDPLLPEVPTFAELGLAGMELGNWTGLMMPVGTPASIVEKVAAECIKVVNLPDVNERIAGHGHNVTGLGPAEFGAVLKADIARWREVVKGAQHHGLTGASTRTHAGNGKLPATIVHYLDLLLLMTHELDAVRASEWKLLYVLRQLADAKTFAWFVALHVPLFFSILWFSHCPSRRLRGGLSDRACGAALAACRRACLRFRRSVVEPADPRRRCGGARVSDPRVQSAQCARALIGRPPAATPFAARCDQLPSRRSSPPASSTFASYSLRSQISVMRRSSPPAVVTSASIRLLRRVR